MFEKAVKPGTTSRLTRRKKLTFLGLEEKHVNFSVRLGGWLSRGQPDPHQSKQILFVKFYWNDYESIV